MTDPGRIKKSKKKLIFLNIRWRSELSKLVIIPQYLLSGETCTPRVHVSPGYIGCERKWMWCDSGGRYGICPVVEQA